MNFNTFIATTGDNLVRASRDTKGNWPVETLLPGTQVNCFAADPHNPNIVYAGTQGDGVLRSEDWGQSWHPCGMAGQVVKSLVVSARERDVLYASLSNGDVWHTVDYGDSWQRLPLNLSHISREMIMLHEK